MNHLLKCGDALFPVQSLIFGFAAGQHGGAWWGLFALHAVLAVLFAMKYWPRREI